MKKGKDIKKYTDNERESKRIPKERNNKGRKNERKRYRNTDRITKNGRSITQYIQTDRQTQPKERCR